MTICSCVIHARTGQGAAVAARVAALPGAEIHGGVPEDTLVVTLDDDGDYEPDAAPGVATLAKLSRIPGVVHTVLIYHYGARNPRNGITRQ